MTDIPEHLKYLGSHEAKVRYQENGLSEREIEQYEAIHGIKSIHKHKWSDESISIHYSGKDMLTMNIGKAKHDEKYVDYNSIFLRERDAKIIACSFGYELVKKEDVSSLLTTFINLNPQLTPCEAKEIAGKMVDGENTVLDVFAKDIGKSMKVPSHLIGEEGKHKTMTETEYLMQSKNGERLQESINQFGANYTINKSKMVDGVRVISDVTLHGISVIDTPPKECDRSKLNGVMSAESEGGTSD